MNRTGKELLKAAINICEEGADFPISVQEMRGICASCADKMEDNNMTSVNASVVVKAYNDGKMVSRVADKWETMPKGWTDESRKKFWDTLTGGLKHPVKKCIKEMTGKVDDPGRFCGALADRVIPGWRSKEKKK